MKKLCVFCGSSDGKSSEHMEMVIRLGKKLAERGVTLVYGGGNWGLMGALARSIMDNGGKAIGVIPECFDGHELSILDGVEEIKVPDFATRKQKMLDISDAFLTITGGIGSLDELSDLWTWKSLGLHDKPVGLYNHNGFYNDLIKFLEHTNTEGFTADKSINVLSISDNLDVILDVLLENGEK